MLLFALKTRKNIDENLFRIPLASNNPSLLTVLVCLHPLKLWHGRSADPTKLISTAVFERRCSRNRQRSFTFNLHRSEVGWRGGNEDVSCRWLHPQWKTRNCVEGNEVHFPRESGIYCCIDAENLGNFYINFGLISFWFITLEFFPIL